MIMYLGDLDSYNNADKTNQSQTKSISDATSPAQVIVTQVTEDNGQVTIDWTDPVDENFDHVEITWMPDGAAVQTISNGIETYTATGLINDTKYTFSIYSVDSKGNRSSAVIVVATPTIIYYIYTADDLNAVRGGIREDWDKTKSYVMMADVDLSSYSPWTPIGTSGIDYFSGNFNGNGHTITGLYINNPTTNYQGLFGYVSGSSVIRNLTILNCDITGNQYTGSLAGRFLGDNKANISQVHVTGIITGTSYTAGLIGQLALDSTWIERCSAVVTIRRPSSASSYCFAGLVGQLQQGGIRECYTVGDFENTESSYMVGGISGWVSGSIENCYSRMNVTGYSYVGGIIGRQDGTTTKCYATGDIIQGGIITSYFGGLVGYPENGGAYSYYCGTLIGSIMDNNYGTRKTGPEMKQELTYETWDFTTIWNIDGTTNNGFPYLRSNMP